MMSCHGYVSLPGTGGVGHAATVDHRLVKSSNMTSSRRRPLIGRSVSGSDGLTVDSSLVK